MAAAEALVAAGANPTLRAVRDRLRTGSPNTIHRHLGDGVRAARRARRRRCRSCRPAWWPAFSRPSNRRWARALAERDEELSQAQAAAAELAAVGEALERERDALWVQVAALTTERDTLVGRTVEQAAEIMGLKEDLERERQAAERARAKGAQERIIGAGLRERLEQQQAALDAERAALRKEREARAEAQRDLAVHEASRAAAHERVSELAAREQVLAHEFAESRRRVEQLLEAAGTSSALVARMEEAARRDAEERTRLRDELKRLRSKGRAESS